MPGLCEDENDVCVSGAQDHKPEVLTGHTKELTEDAWIEQYFYNICEGKQVVSAPGGATEGDVCKRWLWPWYAKGREIPEACNVWPRLPMMEFDESQHQKPPLQSQWPKGSKNTK